MSQSNRMAVKLRLCRAARQSRVRAAISGNFMSIFMFSRKITDIHDLRNLKKAYVRNLAHFTKLILVRGKIEEFYSYNDLIWR